MIDTKKARLGDIVFGTNGTYVYMGKINNIKFIDGIHFYWIAPGPGYSAAWYYSSLDECLEDNKRQTPFKLCVKGDIIPGWKNQSVLIAKLKSHETKALYEELTELGKGFLKETVERKPKKSNSAVNHPSHYNSGGVECIDAILAARGSEATKEFCICNSMKYLWRLGHKDDAVQEAKKASWYLDKYIELCNREDD